MSKEKTTNIIKGLIIVKRTQKLACALILCGLLEGQIASAVCYGYYGNVPCGDPVGTRYTNCPNADDMVVTARGSKPVWLLNYGSAGYQSLSGIACCSVPVRIEPCDGSPSYDGIMSDCNSTSAVPSQWDTPCNNG